MPTFNGTPATSNQDYSTSALAFADIVDGNYSSSDYPAMDGFITAASRLIDAEIGRWPGFFYPNGANETRYYDGSGEIEQVIDEFASITSVAILQTDDRSSTNYTALAADNWYPHPYNYASLGKPITKLIMDTNTSDYGVWYSIRKGVKVIGVPGYSLTVDARIAQACKMQAIRWFMRAKQGYQDTGASVTIGEHTIKGQLELDPDIKALLYPFKLELA